LLGMEERTLLVGGQINIESVQQQGTKIHVCFPLTAHQSSD
jgi:signal transduction histidine kinase